MWGQFFLRYLEKIQACPPNALNHLLAYHPTQSMVILHCSCFTFRLKQHITDTRRLLDVHGHSLSGRCEQKMLLTYRFPIQGNYWVWWNQLWWCITWMAHTTQVLHKHGNTYTMPCHTHVYSMHTTFSTDTITTGISPHTHSSCTPQRTHRL